MPSQRLFSRREKIGNETNFHCSSQSRWLTSSIRITSNRRVFYHPLVPQLGATIRERLAVYVLGRTLLKLLPFRSRFLSWKMHLGRQFELIRQKRKIRQCIVRDSIELKLIKRVRIYEIEREPEGDTLCHNWMKNDLISNFHIKKQWWNCIIWREKKKSLHCCNNQRHLAPRQHCCYTIEGTITFFTD